MSKKELTQQPAVIFDTHPRDFFILLKPRVMSLAIFTSLCGMLMAPGSINFLRGAFAILCIACGAGGAGCLNMWWEIKTDAIMKRTKNRPLPSGRLDPDSALALGIILTIFPVTFLGLFINWTAAIWLFISILIYIFIYTIYLKPRTSQNIVIGGAAGALPPLIGWVCVTGTAWGETSIGAWILFFLIFFWTPAHFWALCLNQSDDYIAAGFPMLTSIKSHDVTKRAIIWYTFLTVITSFMAYRALNLGYIYLAALVIFGIYFLFQAYRLYCNKIDSKKLFFYSIYYLFFIFLFMIFDFYYLSS